MSDSQSPIPAPPSPAPPPLEPAPASLRERVRRPGTLTLVVGAGFAILLLLWLFTHNRINGLQTELVRELAQAGEYGKESRQTAAQAQQAVRDLDFKLGMLESRL